MRASGFVPIPRHALRLVNTGATYSRIMRKLLSGLEGVSNYVYDVLIHTSTWDEHLSTLRAVFDRVRQACLTMKPFEMLFGIWISPFPRRPSRSR